MKVYRIKHKPSALFYNDFDDKLSKKGTILQHKPDISGGLFVWATDTDKEDIDEWVGVFIPESELEVKEYDLED